MKIRIHRGYQNMFSNDYEEAVSGNVWPEIIHYPFVMGEQ